MIRKVFISALIVCELSVCRYGNWRQPTKRSPYIRGVFMGLDAVVYRHINNLEIDRADKEKALIDEERGEVYFEDPEMARKYGHRPFIAIEKRLGNVAAIGAIDEEIVSVIGDAPSTMREKVLYSGSHCGDFIAYDELDQVDAEIARIKKLSAGARTPLLDGFLSAMTDLVKAAKEQKQPIVFT